MNFKEVDSWSMVIPDRLVYFSCIFHSSNFGWEPGTKSTVPVSLCDCLPPLLNLLSLPPGPTDVPCSLFLDLHEMFVYEIRLRRVQGTQNETLKMAAPLPKPLCVGKKKHLARRLIAIARAPPAHP